MFAAVDRAPRARPAADARRRTPGTAPRACSPRPARAPNRSRRRRGDGGGTGSRPRRSSGTTAAGRSGSCSAPARCPTSMPLRMTFCCAFVSFDHGASMSMPCLVGHRGDRAAWKYCVRWLAHGATAPSFSERSGFGTTSSGSTSNVVPSPSHVSHAPYGELNEKLRGRELVERRAALSGRRGAG